MTYLIEARKQHIIASAGKKKCRYWGLRLRIGSAKMDRKIGRQYGSIGVGSCWWKIQRSLLVYLRITVLDQLVKWKYEFIPTVRYDLKDDSKVGQCTRHTKPGTRTISIACFVTKKWTYRGDFWNFSTWAVGLQRNNVRGKMWGNKQHEEDKAMQIRLMAEITDDSGKKVVAPIEIG